MTKQFRHEGDLRELLGLGPPEAAGGDRGEGQDPAAAKPEAIEPATDVDQVVKTRPELPETTETTDTKTDKITPPPKRQRPINQEAADCGHFVRLQLEVNPTENRKSLVKQWCGEHGGSPSSIYRTLNDHPHLWRPGGHV